MTVLDPEIVKLATEPGKELIKSSYDDVAKPAMQELGQGLKTVGSVLRLVMRPLQTLGVAGHAIFDRLDEHVRQKLADVPPENIVEPPMYISAPLLQAYAFADGDPELGDLFEQLLATAMRKDGRAHPAFVEMIKQITPREAKLLKAIGRGLNWPVLRQGVQSAKLKTRPGFVLTAVIFVPEALYRDLDTSDAMEIETALGNLDRLGLLRIDFTSKLKDHLYAPLRESASYTSLCELLQLSGLNVTDVPSGAGCLSMKPLGMDFLKACTPQTERDQSG